ncbi:MAG: putative quinol monooxygenase [Sneathiella sp.]
MHIISGEFDVKPEYRERIIQMSLDLIPQSLEEAGCVAYRFLEDVAEPNRFLFFERWKSKEDIDAHFGKSYFQAFAEGFPAMIDGNAVIEIHEIASTETV